MSGHFTCSFHAGYTFDTVTSGEIIIRARVEQWEIRPFNSSNWKYIYQNPPHETIFNSDDRHIERNPLFPNHFYIPPLKNTTGEKMRVIFRQKSLRQVGDKLEEKHPSLFKNSEMIKIHNTRFTKEQVHLINELRKVETGNEIKRVTRRMAKLENLSGKGHGLRILDGFDIYFIID